jgi:hypothetical protein
MEEKCKAIVSMVEQICVSCKTGKMRPTGEVITVNPPWYIHRCNNEQCKNTDSYKTQYPRISMETLEGEVIHEIFLNRETV